VKVNDFIFQTLLRDRQPPFNHERIFVLNISYGSQVTMEDFLKHTPKRLDLRIVYYIP